MFDVIYNDETGRKVSELKRPRQELKEIQDKHHIIKRMLFLGYQQKQIAEAVGMTENSISLIKRTPIMQQQLKLMRSAADKEVLDLHAQIAEIAPAALQNIKEVVETGTLNGEPVSARSVLKESNNLLDRHMGKATQTIKGMHAHAHFTADDIKQLREAAMSAGVS